MSKTTKNNLLSLVIFMSAFSTFLMLINKTKIALPVYKALFIIISIIVTVMGVRLVYAFILAFESRNSKKKRRIKPITKSSKRFLRKYTYLGRYFNSNDWKYTLYIGTNCLMIFVLSSGLWALQNLIIRQ